MFNRHVSRQLAAHLEGRLGPADAAKMERHLAGCERCRDERELVRMGKTALNHLPAVHAPDAIWSSIEAALPRLKSRGSPAIRPRRLAFALLGLTVLAGAWYWSAFAHRPGMRWDVVRIQGAPGVDAKPIRGAAHIGAGEWIETDSVSSARVKVGEIGSVEVAPNTRLRIVTARPGEHRLALARGEIRAQINAPPRLFFVDTPSATAVDLGCEYSLHSDESGSGVLQVTRGWVSFQWRGLESLVPAGASCRTQAHSGPGVPYFDDAPEGFKQAVDSFTSDKSGSASLDAILAEARVRDTLTLWHLLARVGLADRERIFDRMVALVPVPPGVSRGKVLALDPDTLARWKDELAWKW